MGYLVVGDAATAPFSELVAELRASLERAGASLTCDDVSHRNRA